jgi:hypothetical protein
MTKSEYVCVGRKEGYMCRKEGRKVKEGRKEGYKGYEGYEGRKEKVGRKEGYEGIHLYMCVFICVCKCVCNYWLLITGYY